MNLIGACRFIAACVRPLSVLVLASILGCGRLAWATSCDAGLSPQQKVSQFKQLDADAERAMQQHRPLDAIGMYEQAVCLEPNSARGFYGLGVAEAAAGQFLKARESLRTSDRLQPTTGMPLMMQVRVNSSLKDMEELKSNLREAATRFPRDAALHSALARFLAEQNLLILALAEAMRSQQASADPNSTLQLAVLENTIGAYDDALKNALAVEQNGDVPKQVRGSAAGIAGLSYESLHQSEQGVRYLREAIEFAPSQANSYLALADLLEQAGKYSDAVVVLRDGMRNVPDTVAFLLPLGVDLIRAERYQEGIDALRALVRVAPKADQAYISLADAARKMGDPAQELAALHNLASYKPDYPMIHVLIARAMLNHAPPDYSKVLHELSLAAIDAPTDPEVLLLRGKAYATLGRFDEAVSALTRSIEMRPLDPGPYYQLAKLYQKLGRAQLAAETFARIRFLESNGPK